MPNAKRMKAKSRRSGAKLGRLLGGLDIGHAVGMQGRGGRDDDEKRDEV